MADANLVRDLMGLGFSPFQATYLGDLLGDSSSPLPIANGGTGQNTAAAALNALAPILTYAATGSNITAQVNNTGDTALTIQKIANQTGDLQKWQDATGSDKVCIGPRFTLEWNEDVAISRLATNSLALGNAAPGDYSGLLTLKNVYSAEGTFFGHTLVSLSNGAAGSMGTITNAPHIGDPTKWAPYDDNGTIRYIPLW